MRCGPAFYYYYCYYFCYYYCYCCYFLLLLPVLRLFILLLVYVFDAQPLMTTPPPLTATAPHPITAQALSGPGLGTPERVFIHLDFLHRELNTIRHHQVCVWGGGGGTGF